MIFVSHRSALEYWRHLEGAGIRPSSSRTRLPEGPELELRKTARMLAAEAAFGSKANYNAAERRLDVLVATPTDRRDSDTMRCHVWSGGLPRDSFAKLARGLYVSSPEFVFLQMARELTLIQLIELGFELCGSYALDSTCEKGFRAREPITSVFRLQTFVNKADGVHGAKSARRALKYIIEGSASPMETVLAMMLTLPMAMGGCALPRPKLNRERSMRVGVGGETRIRRSDLFWPDANLALEYESDLEHLSSRKFSEDSIRRNEFVVDGVIVVTVTRMQMRNLLEFRKLVDQLSRMLGVKKRVTLSDYREKQHMLYGQLLAPGRDRF